MSLILFWLSPAMAAPVLWTSPPTDGQRAFVAAVPGASDSITLEALEDLRSGPADPAAAYAQLGSTLKSVRAFEMRLDGERIIMDDLATALDRIQVVRDAEDRGKLFGALAYQGFAVHRFFGDLLEGDDAEPWRTWVDELAVPTPWRDAVALAPEHEVTAYDIAEAPQRVAFGITRGAVKDVLPGGLRIEGADRGEVWVNGAAVDASGNLRLPPGLHYVHLQVGDQIVGFHKVELEAGGTKTVNFGGEPTEAVDLTSLAPGSAVPGSLLRLIEAADGELWVATPGGNRASLLSLTKGGITKVPVGGASNPNEKQGAKNGGLYGVAGVGAGWFSSGDFYTQNPGVAPRTPGTVNSLSLNGGVGAGLHLGVFRAELGSDFLFTPGEHHVALTGEQGLRLRPAPYAAVGVSWLMASGGFLLPYHPFVGAKGALPLPGGLEVRADFRAGLPLSFTRADGSTYQTLPVFTASGGIAYRFGPGGRTSTF